MLVRVDRAGLKVIDEYRQPVQTNTCVFNWSGTQLYATNGDGCVKLFSYPTPSSLSTSLDLFYTLNAHTSTCYTLSLSPSGDYLAVGGGDALVSLWDSESWICVRTLELVDGAVKSVDFSFDGSYIVAGAEEAGDKKLKIAHVESGEVVHSVDLSQPASQVAWHPSRYALAYSAEREGLKIVGGMG